MLKQELKDSISSVIKTNNTRDITGDILQAKLFEIIDECYGTNSDTSSSTGLFPNGLEFVSESRDFSPTDEGKLLIALSEDLIQLTIPSGIIWQGGYSLGINGIDGTENVSWQTKYGGPYIKGLGQINSGQDIGEHTSETILFTTFPDDGNGSSLLSPISTNIINDNGDFKTMLRYLYDNRYTRFVDNVHITLSRDFQESDKDKILFLQSGVDMTIPNGISIPDGQKFVVYFAESLIPPTIQLYPGYPPFVGLANESIICISETVTTDENGDPISPQTRIIPLGTSLFPNQNYTQLYSATKYITNELSNINNSFIPINGTTNSISGNLEFNNETQLFTNNTNLTATHDISFKSDLISINTSNGSSDTINLIQKSGGSENKFTIQLSDIDYSTSLLLDNRSLEINFDHPNGKIKTNKLFDGSGLSLNSGGDWFVEMFNDEYDGGAHQIVFHTADSSFGQSNLEISSGGEIAFNAGNENGTGYCLLYEDGLFFSSSKSGSRGISSDIDYTSNITEFDFVQKKYADTKLSRKIFNISTITTSENDLNVDYVYNISGGATLALPTAVGNKSEYKIKNVDAISCDIVADLTETIDGASSITLSNQYDSVTIISDGTNWLIY